eukprot:759335-Hanusia_phi.AAC.4
MERKEKEEVEGRMGSRNDRVTTGTQAWILTFGAFSLSHDCRALTATNNLLFPLLRFLPLLASSLPLGPEDLDPVRALEVGAAKEVDAVGDGGEHRVEAGADGVGLARQIEDERVAE